MKFRNRLMVLMVGMALFSNGVLVAITTFQSRALLLDEIRSKVLSIASTTASQVDVASHEKIRAEADMESEEYARLEALFRTVRDSNRREDTNVRFVYTLRPVAGRTSVFEYVVDAEERGSPDKSKIGEIHKPKNEQRLIPLDRNDVQIGSDAYGTFLSATSPIRDQTGTAVALVGVDLNIEEVLARTDRLWLVGLGGMAMAGGVAAFLALVLSRRVSKVLEKLVTVVDRVAAADYDVKAPEDGEDEFSQLGKALNHMVPQIREGMKLKDSLALAMEVQQSLLPSEPPQVNGLEIAGRSIYCDETGGDYFDFLDLSNVSKDRLAIAVGDVTGHGIAAALLMTTARALLRGQAAQGGSLAQLITHMNRHLASDCKAGRFMTMYYLVIDSQTRELHWVSAGHDPAIAYNPATDVFVELAGSDIPMGLDPDWEYTQFERSGWIDGQIIVIGTDGIWETRDAKGRMFGKTGLREIIRANSRRPCSEIAKAITDTLSRYRQGKSQEDDVTLVVIRFVARRADEQTDQAGQSSIEMIEVATDQSSDTPTP